MILPIPPGATALLVLEQNAHLDWDWLNAFPTNVDGSNPIDPGYFSAGHPYRQPANTIYSQAHDLLQLSAAYTYSTCEMGFLQAFGTANPALLQDMIATGRLRIVGGGITSPDSLLSNGECFLRNYLVGLQWMQSVGLPWTRCVWVPDDFGHDSQLPATLVAMGAIAVAFARCPMASAYQGNLTTAQPSPAAGTVLSQAPSDSGGCDFFWSAADGSLVFAHWMPDGYGQGYCLYTGPDCFSGFLKNQTCSPTPYVHVPVASDFSVPLGGGPSGTTVKNTLLDYIAAWTSKNPTTPAVLSTFDEYVESVLEWIGRHRTPLYIRSFHGDPSDAGATTFRSNPYFMGFYASRMNIKSGHEQATRLLLAAETLDAVLASLGIPLDSAPADLLAAWAELVPSTHHDYITGTASDGVVSAEQMPRLGSAGSMGASLIAEQLSALAAALNPPANALLVFNPLGIARAGLVEIPSGVAGQLQLPAGQSQPAADGNVLVYVSVPSAGYQTFTGDYPTPPQAPVLATTDGGASYTLSNALVSATVAQSANWSLTDVTDQTSGHQVLTSGNTFAFYQDAGSIYSFGYECNESYGFDAITPSSIVAGDATVTENGPLRVTLSAPITVKFDGFTTQTYTLQYSLGAGDPFVQMTLQGQAPAGTSMFVQFTFAPGAIAQLQHGTPLHWDYKTPATFGTCDFDSVMEPTHDFVVPLNDVGPMGAIYHQAVPGWAIDSDTLVGAVLRDTPSAGCDERGASGSDSVPHTITYAFRTVTGLSQDATAGAPLQEARAYNTPMFATLATPGSGSAALSLSLASVASPPSCMITAVKRGTLDPGSTFVRLYNPTNQATDIVVSVTGDAANAAVYTALEQAPEQQVPQVTAGGGEFSLTTQSAITTVRLPQFNG